MRLTPLRLTAAWTAIAIAGFTAYTTVRDWSCVGDSPRSAHLLNRVNTLVTSSDSSERWFRDQAGLLSAPSGSIVLERGMITCRHAARARVNALRGQDPGATVRPVVVVRAGPERYVVLDTTSLSGSEWLIALVFDQHWKSVGGFSF
jgi:hypothetical protein